MRAFGLAAASCLAAAAATALAASSTLTFTSGRFSITTLDGSSRTSDTFGPLSPISSLRPDDLVRLESDEILRITLVVPTSGQSSSEESSESAYEEETVNGETVVKRDVTKSSKNSSSGVPEQIILQLINVAQPSKIAGFRTVVNKQDGKVSWNQRVDRLPASLGSENPTYTLRLIIGSAKAAQPLSLDLGQVEIPSLAKYGSSQPSAREIAAKNLGFYPWEEKRYTYRKEDTEDMPGKTRSLLVAAIIVTVPWMVLSGLLSTLIPSLKFKGTPKISTSLLFLSLFFLETLGFRYYRGDFVLFTMLPYFLLGAALATAAVLAGAVKGVGLKDGA